MALFGDSAFFHSALPAICNAAYNRSDLLMILMDNRGAASTGLQPTPATGVNTLGEPAPKMSIDEIARACGVSFVQEIDASAPQDDVLAALRASLSSPGLALLIVKIDCID